MRFFFRYHLLPLLLAHTILETSKMEKTYDPVNLRAPPWAAACAE